MDESSMQFYSQQLGIYPEAFELAKQYLRAILEILLKTHTQDKTLPLLIKLLRLEASETTSPDAIVKMLN